jgi:hypothetical protein
MDVGHFRTADALVAFMDALAWTFLRRALGAE